MVTLKVCLTNKVKINNPISSKPEDVKPKPDRSNIIDVFSTGQPIRKINDHLIRRNHKGDNSNVSILYNDLHMYVNMSFRPILPQKSKSKKNQKLMMAHLN